MRLIWKILRIVAVVVTVAVLTLTVYVARTWNRTWDAPLPNLHATTDPDVIARGEYLVFGPSHCVVCHVSSREEADRFFAGGERPALSGGFPFPADPIGVLYSKNITPDPETGIGRYTDAQIARMLRYSVRPDGQASVLPLMPYGDMSDQDLIAVISFLRAQPPMRKVVPANEWTLVGKVVRSLVATFKPRTEVHPEGASPASQPTRARGAYLARGVANCTGCHTPLDPLTFAPNGPEFSGGSPMEPTLRPGVDPSLWFKPPNITPLAGSALSKFPDRATFIARFQKGGRQHDGSPMPWEAFARMTAEDIGALYEFLRSVPAAGAPAPTDPQVKH